MQEIVKALIPIFAAHLVVLAILVVVVKRLLVSDTMRAVKRIQAVEAEVRKKEETIRREIQEHEKAFAKQKIEAEEELQRHKVRTEKELTRLRDQMLADAKKEGDRILEQAHKNEEKFRQKIALDMEQKAIAYGGDIFQLVFGDRVTGEVNKQFIAELLDALSEIDGDSITVDASQGEVMTSEAMDVEQKQSLEKLLSEKFHQDVHLTEKVDPALLSGLVLKLGSLEIDGSLKNRFGEAIEEVMKDAAG